MVEQEAGRELEELGRAPVVVAHEELGGEEAAPGLVPEVLGQLRLEVQGEEIGAAPGGEMGLIADAGEEVVGATRDHVILVSQPALTVQPLEAAAPVERVAEPDHGVQVAQPSHALLDVRLLEPDRVAPPRVPLFQLRPHQGEEVAGRAGVAQAGLHLLGEDGEQVGAARDEARLREGRARVQVRAGERDAFASRADGVAHAQAHVPQDLERPLHEPPQAVGDTARVQEEQVHVRVRGQLAPPVPAERDHCALNQLPASRAVRFLRGHLADAGHDQVHLVAATPRDLGAAQAEAMAHAEPLGLEPQEAPEGLDLSGARIAQSVPLQ